VEIAAVAVGGRLGAGGIETEGGLFIEGEPWAASAMVRGGRVGGFVGVVAANLERDRFLGDGILIEEISALLVDGTEGLCSDVCEDGGLSVDGLEETGSLCGGKVAGKGGVLILGEAVLSLVAERGGIGDDGA
jgi:hypothetical protein